MRLTNNRTRVVSLLDLTPTFNIWHLFDSLKGDEVLVRQQMLKMMPSEKKKKNKKTVDLQQLICSLRSRYDQKEISLGQLLEELSLLVEKSK
jgi:hypothetical protein